MDDTQNSNNGSALEVDFPLNRTILLNNFMIWPEDSLGEDPSLWVRSTKEIFLEDHLSIVRTVWDFPKDRMKRILIELVHYPSHTEAYDAFLDKRFRNQLAELLEGPKKLFEISFRHPDTIPPSISGVKGNLLVSIRSFGKRDVEVLPWAERISTRIENKPSHYQADFLLTSKQNWLKVNQEIQIQQSLQGSLGEEGYYKFFPIKGTLYFKDNALFFKANEKGRAVIEGFAIETSQKVHGGRLELEIVE